jgi:hypothetical protein
VREKLLLSATGGRAGSPTLPNKSLNHAGFSPWGMLASLAVALLFGGVAAAQGIVGLPAPSNGKGHVTFAAEVIEVAAGKPAIVELRFRVEQGFHVNSHTPKDELLIPTVLKLEDAAGVKVLTQEYPKGAPFKLPGDGQTLDVYQGEFRVRLQVVVPRGQSVLKGALRYQACDSAACFPPRTLVVDVPITGK